MHYDQMLRCKLFEDMTIPNNFITQNNLHDDGIVKYWGRLRC